MRLLRAELTKLRRPLTYWIALAAVLASLAFAWQGARNASAARTQSAAPARLPTCRDLALPPGPLCDRAVAVQGEIDAYRQQQARTQPETRHNAHSTDALPVENPLGAGKLAAGFMASLAGALLVFLLAAGHVGNEWNGRTMKVLLTQEGRRWRVLAAKAASLWIAAVAILAVDWAVLAAFSPILHSAYPLGGPALSWSAAWTAVAADAARAPFVLMVFTIIGVAAAVIVRNALGAFILASTVMLASLLAAGNLSTVAQWTLVWWVSGWMQFRSHGYVIYHFWVDAFPASTHAPGALVGFIGLLSLISAVTVVAIGVFQRLDVTT